MEVKKKRIAHIAQRGELTCKPCAVYLLFSRDHIDTSSAHMSVNFVSSSRLMVPFLKMMFHDYVASSTGLSRLQSALLALANVAIRI